MAGERAVSRLKLLYITATDVFHALLGVFTVYIIKHLGHVFPFNVMAGLSVMAVFYAYQLQDDDPPEERLGDLLEFTMGLIAGQAL